MKLLENINWKLVIGVILTAAVVSAAGTLVKQEWGGEEASEQTPIVETVVEQEGAIKPSEELKVMASKDGQTAFELLKENAEIEYQDSDFGIFVTSINGLPADDSHYWALYIDDQYSTVGAADAVLEAGQSMRWSFEKIDSAF